MDKDQLIQHISRIMEREFDVHYVAADRVAERIVAEILDRQAHLTQAPESIRP